MLLPGQVRFIAKPRGKAWGVYDRALGSWPAERALTGRVQQDVDQSTAEAEATRLNGLYQSPVRVG